MVVYFVVFCLSEHSNKGTIRVLITQYYKYININYFFDMLIKIHLEWLCFFQNKNVFCNCSTTAAKHSRPQRMVAGVARGC